jgi:hypothetical protein
VIGSSLESMLFSLALENSMHLDNGFNPPEFFEKDKVKLWSNVKWYLSLFGRSANFELPDSIRILDGVCKISAGGQVQKIKFEKCIIFDALDIVVDNDVIDKDEQQLKVIDHFYLGGMSKNYLFNKIETEENFVKEIYPYNSGRVEGSDYVTDCQIVSYLSKEDINNFDYSDTMVKFKLEKVLLSAGFKPKIAGKLKSGANKYSRPVLEHQYRKVINRDRLIYEDSENVIFVGTKNTEELLYGLQKG